MRRNDGFINIQKQEWNRNANYYTNYLEMVRRPHGKQFKITVKQIIERMHLGKNDRLIDIGCGSGALLKEIIKQTGIKNFIGIDFAEKMLIKARRILKNKFINAGSDSIPVKDNSFNKVICVQIVKYFPDNDYIYRTLDELIRICRPGGSIIMDAPDIKKKKKFYIFLKKVYHKIKRIVFNFKYPISESIYEWRFYDIDKITDYLRSKHGVNDIKIFKKDKTAFNYKYAVDILIKMKNKTEV